MSIWKHVAFVAFVAFATTVARTNWDYVNAHSSGPVLSAVTAGYVGAFVFWGVVWGVAVLIWRGLKASLKRK